MDGSGNSLVAVGVDGTKRRVSYFYDDNISKYCYSQAHPMKPERIQLAHLLLMQYGLHHQMEVLRPTPAQDNDLCTFHREDYVNFLRTVTPHTKNEQLDQLQRFNVDRDCTRDCPVFEDLYAFCQSYAGGSISGAVKLNNRDSDIVINWAGGLHHAKKCQASGFCYVNDIVLAILELLKHHVRVLYVDIDIHHGDGVEEAFYTTDRVMTVSFHKCGDNYFPGTGDLEEIGHETGKYYSVNVPLNDGIDDECYQSLFKPIMSKVMEVFQPGAVVLQCGADSLSGDKLGLFNLSVKGHAECVRFMRSFNVPLLLLGGGGYTMQNVARCWCYETGVAVGVELDDKMPYNKNLNNYFAPHYNLHTAPSKMENQNSRRDVDFVRERVFENLSKLTHAPSVQFSERPPDTDLGEKEEENVDVRGKSRVWDGEMSNSDSEDDHFGEPRRRNRHTSEPAFPRRAVQLLSPEHNKEEKVGEEAVKMEVEKPSALTEKSPPLLASSSASPTTLDCTSASSSARISGSQASSGLDEASKRPRSKLHLKSRLNLNDPSTVRQLSEGSAHCSDNVLLEMKGFELYSGFLDRTDLGQNFQNSRS